MLMILLGPTALRHKLGLETHKYIIQVPTLKQQVYALTSPITASELEGPMGVIKAIATAGGKHTEPLLRAVLLARRGAAPRIAQIGHHLPMVLKAARWLSHTHTHAMRDVVRADRALSNRKLRKLPSRAQSGNL